MKIPAMTSTQVLHARADNMRGQAAVAQKKADNADLSMKISDQRGFDGVMIQRKELDETKAEQGPMVAGGKGIIV